MKNYQVRVILEMSNVFIYGKIRETIIHSILVGLKFAPNSLLLLTCITNPKLYV